MSSIEGQDRGTAQSISTVPGPEVSDAAGADGPGTTRRKIAPALAMAVSVIAAVALAVGAPLLGGSASPLAP